MKTEDNDPFKYKSWDVMETVVASFFEYVNMRCFAMFVTTVCILYVSETRWPKVKKTDPRSAHFLLTPTPTDYPK